MSAERLARALYAAFPPPAPVGGTRVFPTSWEEQDERWRAQLVVGMQSLLDQGLIAEPAEVERDVIHYLLMLANSFVPMGRTALLSAARSIEGGCHRKGRLTP